VLRWTQRARADLIAIYDYIAKDSPVNAKIVAREILERARLIEHAPRAGRQVPELADEALREVPIHTWRILYELRGTDIFIVTLVHKRRAPTSDELPS
jgi:toxin ParE1/3/4